MQSSRDFSRGSALDPMTCWSCRAELSHEELYCARCGEAQAEEYRVDCGVECRHGYFFSEFIAFYGHKSERQIAARSKAFRSPRREAIPPRTPVACARLEELCTQLQQEGWERCGTGAFENWYAHPFRRRATTRRHSQVSTAGARPQTPSVVEFNRVPAGAMVTSERAGQQSIELDVKEETTDEPWYVAPHAEQRVVKVESDLCARIGAYKWP